VRLHPGTIVPTSTSTREGPRFCEAISPELVLVDPVLALEARALLPDRPPFPPERSRPIAAAGDLGRAWATTEPIPRAAVPMLHPAPERTPSPCPPALEAEMRRPHGRLRPATAGFAAGLVVAVAAAGVLGTDPVRLDAPSFASPVVGPAQATPVETVSATREATPEPEPTTGGGPAGSRTSGASSGRSATPSAAEPPVGDGSRVFVWPEVSSAREYEFQLFRGDTLVFQAQPQTPRLELPSSWRFGGQEHRLLPGEYRWYVWAVSARTGERAETALIQAKLEVRS
jgi:hypothetical protein